MPNWKKVIVSGSDAALTSVTATAGFTGSLQGTASWALNSATASIADRATRLDLIALNQTGGTLAKGTVVRIPAATNSSDTPRIVTASYESDATSAATLGITAEAISNGATGSVILEGVLTGVNTSGWNTGTLLFLGTGGAITATPPTSPNHGVRLGQVIREQSSNGSIYVTVDNGAELGELHDVLDSNYGTTTNYGDLLVRSGSVWINSKQMTGSYGLTGSLTATTSVTSPSHILNLSSGYFGYLEANGAQFRLRHSNSGTHIDMSSGNATTFSQVGYHNNGLNITPGGNSTSYGLIITAGSYPAATLLRAGTNTLVVTGSRVGIGTTTPSASLNVIGTTLLSGSSNTISGSVLTVYGSGSLPVFTVQGSQGELFSVTDSLSGSLYSVNDVSGLPILEVFSDNTILMGNYQDPMLVTTTKLVTTASGAFALYSLPTASYDTAYFDYSIKSGSNARAGSIMAIQLGTSVNYTETTTTDFGTTSGVTFNVQVSGSNMILSGSATTSGWTIKTVVRGI